MFYLDLINEDKFSIKEKVKCLKRIKLEYIGDTSSYYGTNVDYLSLKIKISIYKLDKKTIKKLDKFINITLEKQVYISEKILSSKKEYEYLKRYFDLKGVKIVNDKTQKNKLFKIMLLNSLDKIKNDINEFEYKIRIGILINEINQDFIFLLEKLAIKYKEIIVMTKSMIRLEYIVNKLYREYGIVIVLKNKNLFIKSDIILDFGYSLEYKETTGSRENKKLDEDKFIVGKCIYINLLNDSINEYIKILDGICINNIKLLFESLKYTKEYKDYFKNLKNFNESDVYQSIILKNTSLENMIKIIQKDNIKIECFIGNNGIINQKEFIKFGNYLKDNKRVLNLRKK